MFDIICFVCEGHRTHHTGRPVSCTPRRLLCRDCHQAGQVRDGRDDASGVSTKSDGMGVYWKFQGDAVRSTSKLERSVPQRPNRRQGNQLGSIWLALVSGEPIATSTLRVVEDILKPHFWSGTQQTRGEEVDIRTWTPDSTKAAVCDHHARRSPRHFIRSEWGRSRNLGSILRHTDRHKLTLSPRNHPQRASPHLEVEIPAVFCRWHLRQRNRYTSQTSSIARFPQSRTKAEGGSRHIMTGMLSAATTQKAPGPTEIEAGRMGD